MFEEFFDEASCCFKKEQENVNFFPNYQICGDKNKRIFSKLRKRARSILSGSPFIELVDLILQAQ